MNAKPFTSSLTLEFITDPADGVTERHLPSIFVTAAIAYADFCLLAFLLLHCSRIWAWHFVKFSEVGAM
jgi:hypothetical protein